MFCNFILISSLTHWCCRSTLLNSTLTNLPLFLLLFSSFNFISLWSERYFKGVLDSFFFLMFLTNDFWLSIYMFWPGKLESIPVLLGTHCSTTFDCFISSIKGIDASWLLPCTHQLQCCVEYIEIRVHSSYIAFLSPGQCACHESQSFALCCCLSVSSKDILLIFTGVLSAGFRIWKELFLHSVLPIFALYC